MIRVRGTLLTGIGFVMAVGVGFWIGSMVRERPPEASASPAEVVRDARDELVAVLPGIRDLSSLSRSPGGRRLEGRGGGTS